MGMRHYEKDYFVIINEAVRSQNQFLNRFKIDLKNRVEQFKFRIINLVYPYSPH